MNQTTKLEDSNGNIIVQVTGSGINVAIGTAPHLVLIPHHRQKRSPRRPLDLLGFTTLLPLVGREAELGELTAWLDGSAPISLGVVSGDAGSGKSRLAIELCAIAENKNWLAGFLTHAGLDRFFRQQNSSIWGWDQPTLVVVDDAAAKTSLLKRWLEELAQNQRTLPPLRLLLLERHADPAIGWFQGVRTPSNWTVQAGLADMLDGAPLIRLPGLESLEQRQALVETFWQAAVPLVPSSPPSMPVSSQLGAFIRDPRRATLPLDLAMAAVIAVQAGDSALLSQNRSEMAFTIAGFERTRLHLLATERGLNPAIVEHMAVLVTLAGTLSKDQLAAQLAAEAQAESWTSLPIRADRTLFDILRNDQNEAGALQPDLIGEAFALSIMTEAPDEEARQTILRWHHAYPTVGDSLIRLCQDFADDPRGLSGLNWLSAVAQSLDQIDDLIAFIEQIPQETVSMREIAADISGKIVRIIKNIKIDVQKNKEKLIVSEVLAIFINNHFVRLFALGFYREAQEKIEEAVYLCRLLAAEDSDTFTPDLATSLNNLSNCLFALRRYEKALEAIEEAVNLYRLLATEDSHAFTPRLATSLNSLSNCLSALRYYEKALEAIEEAVNIYRLLAAGDFNAFASNLAGSLNTLSNRLSELGSCEGALRAIEEAVKIRCTLAAARPDVFIPAFALSLSNLSKCLFDLNRFEEALAKIEEAIKIRRDLAKKIPRYFNLELAKSLAFYADILEKNDKITIALERIQDAISLLAPYFISFPQVHAELMQAMVRAYLRRSESAGVAPDEELLSPITAIFQKMERETENGGADSPGNDSV